MRKVRNPAFCHISKPTTHLKGAGVKERRTKDFTRSSPETKARKLTDGVGNVLLHSNVVCTGAKRNSC